MNASSTHFPSLTREYFNGGSMPLILTFDAASGGLRQLRPWMAR
jgi:hypothetical protein